MAQQAVAEDPDFASAQIWLAWCLFRTGAAPEDVQAAASRAKDLAPGVMDWERYWIEGSYYRFLGDDDQAIAAYRALLDVAPDHYWGVNNIGGILGGRAAMPFIMRLAELRPRDPRAAAMAVSVLTGVGEPERARPYADRVVSSFNETG